MEVAPGEKFPGEHFIPEPVPRIVEQVLDAVEKLYQEPPPSNGFQKFPQVAAALSDYMVFLRGTISYNNHTSSNRSAVEYLAKV